MKKVAIWASALILTFIFAYYQRRTGPTYPVTEKFTYNNQIIKFQYPRSHSSSSDAVIKIVVPDSLIYGYVYQRVYPLNTGYTIIHLRRFGDTLVGLITQLPPAGKMQYYVELYKGKDIIYTRKDNPVIIRFKGDVPISILLPHILAMFFALFLSVTAGLLALFDDMSYRKVQIWSFVFLILGGFILGPIVQHHAFGQWWTGIPFGWDLTDNKTLIIFIGWLAAIIANRKQARRWWTVAAALLMIIIYLIPHSLHGSTLDPNTGKVISGMIISLLML
jgi:hypothetical protein